MQLVITDRTLQKLHELLQQKKFCAEFGRHPVTGVELLLQVGANNEETRARCELVLNQLLNHLITGVEKQPTKAFVMESFSTYLSLLDNEDTEEREQATGYCEQIMDILEIESSDGLLNSWLYGFDPVDYLKSQQQE